jgi:hypothetical protein
MLGKQAHERTIFRKVDRAELCIADGGKCKVIRMLCSKWLISGRGSDQLLGPTDCRSDGSSLAFFKRCHNDTCSNLQPLACDDR